MPRSLDLALESEYRFQKCLPRSFSRTALQVNLMRMSSRHRSQTNVTAKQVCCNATAPRRSRDKSAGAIHAVQELIICIPQRSKSRILRVATGARRDRAIAAIMASNCKMGRPGAGFGPELFSEHLLDGRQQSRSALARLQHLNAIQNFRLSNCRREDGPRILRGQPTHDDTGRQRFENFRKDVRVEHDHFVSLGGRRTASRERSVSSTPPKGAR